MPTDDEVRLQLRLPVELHGQLQARAAGEGRSLNAQIVQMLRTLLLLEGIPMKEYQIKSTLLAKGYSNAHVLHIPVDQIAGGLWKVDVLVAGQKLPIIIQGEYEEVLARIARLP